MDVTGNPGLAQYFSCTEMFPPVQQAINNLVGFPPCQLHKNPLGFLEYTKVSNQIQPVNIEVDFMETFSAVCSKLEMSQLAVIHHTFYNRQNNFVEWWCTHVSFQMLYPT